MATIDTIPRLAGTRVYWRAQLLDALDRVEMCRRRSVDKPDDQFCLDLIRELADAHDVARALEASILRGG